VEELRTPRPPNFPPLSAFMYTLDTPPFCSPPKVSLPPKELRYLNNQRLHFPSSPPHGHGLLIFFFHCDHFLESSGLIFPPPGDRFSPWKSFRLGLCKVFQRDSFPLGCSYAGFPLLVCPFAFFRRPFSLPSLPVPSNEHSEFQEFLRRDSLPLNSHHFWTWNESPRAGFLRSDLEMREDLRIPSFPSSFLTPFTNKNFFVRDPP